MVLSEHRLRAYYLTRSDYESAVVSSRECDSVHMYAAPEDMVFLSTRYIRIMENL
jgi:hypothetical protein